MKEERLIGNSGIQEVRQQCLEAVEEIRQAAGVLNDYFEVQESPEFIEVTKDSEGKVLEGTQKDDTKVIGGGLNVGGSASVRGDIKVLGNMEVSGVSYKVIKSPEYLAAWVDAEYKVIFGFKADGKTYVGDADFLDDLKRIKEFLPLGVKIDWDALSIITLPDNPEFLNVEIDEEGKVLSSRNKEGTKREHVGFETPNVSIDGHAIKTIEDPEGRSEITTDSEGKIISYRDNDGVKHEKAGLSTKSLKLSNEGITEFKKDLMNSGFQPVGEWSESSSLEIPMPKSAMINISGISRMPGTKTANSQAYFEMWDMNGNYFKKRVILNAQGSSSLGYPKKNFAADFCNDEWEGDDTFVMRIGDWVPQDSFHFKAYYTDAFRGVNIVSYRLYEMITNTRGIIDNRVWKRALLPNSISYNKGFLPGTDDFNINLDNGAKGFPDGFPCRVYLNGTFYGIFIWQLKKHRDNYQMDRNNEKHIHLDGIMPFDMIWGVNGNIDWDVWGGQPDPVFGETSGIEVRNPKPKKSKWVLTCADGSTYDGDAPKEIMGEDNPGYDSTNKNHVKSNKVKQAIIELTKMTTKFKTARNGGATDSEMRSLIEQYLDVTSLIDYQILGDLTNNWDGFMKNWQWTTYDGVKWSVNPYDMDNTFGEAPQTKHRRTYKYADNTTKDYLEYPSDWVLEYFNQDLEERYALLRETGIINTERIMALFTQWLSDVGVHNFESEKKVWPNATYADNIYRVQVWVDTTINNMDNVYHYNG